MSTLSVDVYGFGTQQVSVFSQGALGPDGLSAYQVAVANGFVGTEPAWLESLKPSFATNAETIAGTNTTKAVTPAGVAVVNEKYDVRRADFGAANSAATNNAAIPAIMAAIPSGRATVLFPPGEYNFSTPLDFTNKGGVSVEGVGATGEDSAVSAAATVLRYSGAGGAIRWAIGQATTLFSGIHITGLAIRSIGATSDPCAIHLGNASSAIIERVTATDFSGAGIRITGASGSQYNTIDKCSITDCQIGIDAVDTNGLRIIGGLIEANVITPPAGSVAIKSGVNNDALYVIGTILQGYDTLLDIDSDNATCVAVRCEGWETYAYDIAGNYNTIIGGHANNYINGSVGTAVRLTGNNNILIVPHLAAAAVLINDTGLRNTIINSGVDYDSKLPGRVESLTTQNLIVQKAGVGAQNPQMKLQSNAIDGPVMKTESSFTRMVLDHAYASAAGLDLRVRGTNAVRIDHDGTAIKLGFYGTSAIVKQTGVAVTAASIHTALVNLGLIT